MSLLMDALRKAEEAKKQAETDACAKILQTDLADTDQALNVLPIDAAGAHDQKNPANAETDISLEFETYPDSSVAAVVNAAMANDDITIDLEPAQENENNEEVELQVQGLELETIPFDEEIPTLVPDAQSRAKTFSMEPRKESVASIEADSLAESPTSNEAIAEQRTGAHQQEENLEAVIAQTQQASESTAVAQELDSLFEDLEPELEVPDKSEASSADLIPTEHDLASSPQDLLAETVESKAKPLVEPEPTRADVEQPTSQIQTDTAPPVNNDKSHFSAQSLFAAKTNARKAKRKRVQQVAAMMLALAAGSVIAYNWLASNPANPLVSVAMNYLMNADLAPQAEPVATDLGIAAVSANPLQSGTQTTAATAVEITAQANVSTQQEPAVPVATTAVVAVEPLTSNTELTTVITESVAENLVPVMAEPQSDQAAQLAVQPNTTGQPQVETAVLEPAINFISFNRSSGTTTVIDSSLEKAYQAYQSGDLDGAQRLYQAALVAEPLNRNALLGLAAIAAGNNETIVALDLYSRLLSRDPTDPIARAGILDLRPTGSTQQQERELKNLITAHPGIAPLYFALGNVYALQQNWTQAQQAYFDALRRAKSSSLQPGAVNPDYAYNLAISLEHLNKLGPARNYYEEALQYSAYHPASFNVERVRSRLTNLGGGLAQ